MTVRVRIAPSPTGDPHVGTAYMALFNYIFARHHGGKFLLRIEDTDRTRSRPEYEENIYKALKWAGLQWDEGPDVGGPFGPYRQSERTEIYREYCQKLVDSGRAYPCFATAQELQEMREVMAAQGLRGGYDRRYRNLSVQEVKDRIAAGESYVIRLKVPLTGECVYEDAIKGRTTVPWADVDDQVLMKSDGFPTYHLANVVDDHLMEISHVIRGDEWMSSTPKHILLYDSFGWTPPQFMHMPLLLGTDGKKLSKRKNPTSIFFYRDSGYLPEAFLNFLTLMGYSMPGDKEIYSLQEIIAEFDARRIGVSGAIFDLNKLDWINQQYLIQNIPENKLWQRITSWAFPEEKIAQIMPLVHTRIQTFSDFFSLCDFFFVHNLNYTAELFQNKLASSESLAMMLQVMLWELEAGEKWDRTGFETASRNVATLFGANYKKVVISLLFSSLMAKRQGPPLFDSAAILGRDITRARFLNSIEFLGGLSAKKSELLKKAWEAKDCTALLTPPPV